LALARLGELPFFLLICWIAWAWGRRLTDERGGALAVLGAAANPNLLAHAGLATTDIAVAATVPLALFVAERWLDRPDKRSSVVLGAALALAGLSKFSALAFLAPALLGAYVTRSIVRRDWRLGEGSSLRSTAIALGLVAVTTMLAVWAAYRFDVGPVAPDSGLVVPAPAFLRGIADFARHGADGHPAFLFGQISDRGWWYYYPVAFLLKTPLPLLVFGCAGGIVAGRMAFRREAWRPAVPLLGLLAILLVAATSRVDIGVRLVLPMYPLLAVLASLGAIRLWELAASAPVRRPALRSVLAAAVALWVVEPIRDHPDHLAYFSPLAGPNPEHALVDSNLDWGQDLYRLGDAMRDLQIDSIRVAYFGSANLRAAGLTNARQLFPGERPTGWIAASETLLAGAWVGNAYAWLQAYTPVRRIGRSMRLYYIPAVRVN
jgi:4-amino-4-deoxy-L-arabinose transferase-like glycosyltransferase